MIPSTIHANCIMVLMLLTITKVSMALVDIIKLSWGLQEVGVDENTGVLLITDSTEAGPVELPS